MKDLAVVALTPRGHDLAHRLVQRLSRGEVLVLDGDVRQGLEALFQEGRPLVCIMALGIVVRLLGPLVNDKRTDPPVVVLDEAGSFAISVLGGHLGGANAITREISKAIGAVPVITTASECLDLPPLDLIGGEWGWRIEGHSPLTKVMAAAVRGERIGVYQEAGRRDWWKTFGASPPTFQAIQSWPPRGYWAGLLAITDRLLSGIELYPTVVYRPPTLVLGVGCRRECLAAEIEAHFQDLCQRWSFSPLCLSTVATVSLKSDEAGLHEFAAAHEVALQIFSVAELAGRRAFPTPSEVVRNKIGIAGVAEPAALLAAGTRQLLVPKFRGARITMALAGEKSLDRILHRRGSG